MAESEMNDDVEYKRFVKYVRPRLFVLHRYTGYKELMALLPEMWQAFPKEQLDRIARPFRDIAYDRDRALIMNITYDFMFDEVGPYPTTRDGFALFQEEVVHFFVPFCDTTCRPYREMMMGRMWQTLSSKARSYYAARETHHDARLDFASTPDAVRFEMEAVYDQVFTDIKRIAMSQY